jgi:hypothetical protein
MEITIAEGKSLPEDETTVGFRHGKICESCEKLMQIENSNYCEHCGVEIPKEEAKPVVEFPVHENHNKQIDRNENESGIVINKYVPFQDIKKITQIVLKGAKREPYALKVFEQFTYRELDEVSDDIISDDVIASKRFPFHKLKNKGPIYDRIMALLVVKRDAKRIYYLMHAGAGYHSKNIDDWTVPIVDAKLAKEIIKASCSSGEHAIVEMLSKLFSKTVGKSLDAGVLSRRALEQALKKNDNNTWYPIIDSYISAAKDFVWTYDHLHSAIVTVNRAHYRKVLYNVMNNKDFDRDVAIGMVRDHFDNLPEPKSEKQRDKNKTDFKVMVNYIIDSLVVKSFKEHTPESTEAAAKYIALYKEIFKEVPNSVGYLWFNRACEGGGESILIYAMDIGYKVEEHDLGKLLNTYRDFYDHDRSVKWSIVRVISFIITEWQSGQLQINEKEKKFFEKLSELLPDNIENMVEYMFTRYKLIDGDSKIISTAVPTHKEEVEFVEDLYKAAEAYREFRSKNDAGGLFYICG